MNSVFFHLVNTKNSSLAAGMMPDKFSDCQKIIILPNSKGAAAPSSPRLVRLSLPEQVKRFETVRQRRRLDGGSGSRSTPAAAGSSSVTARDVRSRRIRSEEQSAG